MVNVMIARKETRKNPGSPRIGFRLLLLVGILALIATSCGPTGNGTTDTSPLPDENYPDLLVGSCDTKSILRYNGRTGKFKGAFVKPGSGGLDCPEGDMIIGPDGDLYVASFSPRRVHPEQGVIFNDQVLRFSGKTGEFVEIVAKPSTMLNGPHGLAFGPDSQLVITTRFSQMVSHIDRSTGELIAFQGPDGFLKDPATLHISSDGKLLVADYEAGRIFNADPKERRLDESVVFQGGGLVHPHSLTTRRDGKLYVTNYPGNEILRFDERSGKPEGVFVKSGAGGLDFPAALSFGIDGHLYVTSCPKDMVLRYHGVTGEFMDVFVKAGSGGLKGATGMVWLPT